MDVGATAEARFWSRVDKRFDGCWLWTGALNGNGYGKVSIDAELYLVHRVAWTVVHGEIPEGLQIDHLCRVRHCVNPAHLEPVTPSTNIRRSPLVMAQVSQLSKLRASKRTHCPQGHPYAGDNLIIENGYRRCRECRRAGMQRRRQPAPPRTHCKRGHLLDDPNIYIDPRGHRICRACRAERKRQFRRRQAQPVTHKA